MLQPTWNILDPGRVDSAFAVLIEYDCPVCWRAAWLPVHGLAIAQNGADLVFDTAEYAVPARIRCRACRRVFGHGDVTAED